MKKNNIIIKLKSTSRKFSLYTHNRKIVQQSNLETTSCTNVKATNIKRISVPSSGAPERSWRNEELPAGQAGCLVPPGSQYIGLWWGGPFSDILVQFHCKIVACQAFGTGEFTRHRRFRWRGPELSHD
jgi:hypothetical protein